MWFHGDADVRRLGCEARPAPHLQKVPGVNAVPMSGSDLLILYIFIMSVLSISIAARKAVESSLTISRNGKEETG